MRVVHNVQFFYWFELGRTRIMEEFMSLDAAMELGVAMPVVENQCTVPASPSATGTRWCSSPSTAASAPGPESWSSPTRSSTASSRRKWPVG